ncbi:MAG: HAD-IIA family hydrolase [Acidobacteriota bacterium]|nr:HAD-IIA family hydrolase [Acidobacteriota bacterium]
MNPRGLLCDIDGTLVEREADDRHVAVPGAVESVTRLKAEIPLRYVTNTTSRTHVELAAALSSLGFPVDPEEVVTPARLARQVLVERDEARGVLIASGPSLSDYGWFELVPADEARAVLVVSEAHGLSISELFPAVEALLGGARLYTAQENRVFRRGGRLVPDIGPLAAYLGYAAGKRWEAFGKPSPLLFESIARELGLETRELAMVGDDAEFDVAGALAAGVGSGILVRTGKYRRGDEVRVSPRPTRTIDSIAGLVAALG